MNQSPLGQLSAYPSKYDASLLYPILRSLSREKLTGYRENLFFGKDLWTAYEISWLNAKGKPQVALGQFEFDCHSDFIIESKSFKLYLNSFNQTRFASSEDVARILSEDLSQAVGAKVQVSLIDLEDALLSIDSAKNAIALDRLDIEVVDYRPNSTLLQIGSTQIVKQSFISHLLKTNCPVTGQPDWASVLIEYEGNEIQAESLLRYLISFREHQDFHEHCIERIFVDILEQCRPESLSVYGRYTRRGGLDINPFRSTSKTAVPNVGRLVRQ